MREMCSAASRRARQDRVDVEQEQARLFREVSNGFCALLVMAGEAEHAPGVGFDQERRPVRLVNVMAGDAGDT